MQERLDQTCHLDVGTRDAVHVPIIVINSKNYDIKPGEWIRFTDDSYTRYEVCNKKDAHGIVNPFVNSIHSYDSVVVFLVPGITTPVRHNFDIYLDRAALEREELEREIEEMEKNDPNCAGCYYIENGEIHRS